MNRGFSERDYLLSPPREFAVYNATDSPVEMAFDGETRTIPPANKTVPINPVDSFASHSCIGLDGELIPGTLVIRDIPGPRGFCDGGRPGEWSAAQCIRETLGLDPQTGLGHSAHYKKGIAIISSRPSPDEIEAVKAEAGARYSEWLIGWAENVRDEVNIRGAKHRALGLNYSMTPKEHMELAKADAILQAAEVRYKADARSAMGLEVEEIADPDDLETLLQTKADELASKKAATTAERVALAAMLVDDPDFKRILKKAYWDGRKKAAKTAGAAE